MEERTGGHALPGINDAIAAAIAKAESMQDTQEFDPASEDGAPWSYPVNRHDEAPVDTGIEPKEPKVPEPALVRGAVAAVIGLIGYILGKQIDGVVVDQIMDIYAVAAPLALAWWIRSRVTPVPK